MGPALFHRAQARFKKMVGGTASSAVATRRASVAESSEDESLSEPAGDISYVPYRLYATKGALVVRNSPRDSLLAAESEQLSSNTVAGAHIPTPQRKVSALPECLRIRPNADRIRDDKAAMERDYATTTLAKIRQSVTRLESTQHLLDQEVARVDQTLWQHLEEGQARREAQCARNVAAAEERVVEAEIKVSYERKKADAQRLESRVVEEVVPLSAEGKAHGDAVEIRRLAAPRAARQSVPDSSYPRF